MAETTEPGLDLSATGDDKLVIAGESFNSRLVTGTGGASSLDVLERALRPPAPS